MREGSIVTCCGFDMLFASRWVLFMPSRPFALVPRGSAVLAEGLWRCGIGAAGDLQCFGFELLLLQRSKHTLRRERCFPQAHAHGVINGISNGGNRGGKRAFTRFLR